MSCAHSASVTCFSVSTANCIACGRKTSTKWQTHVLEGAHFTFQGSFIAFDSTSELFFVSQVADLSSARLHGAHRPPVCCCAELYSMTATDTAPPKCEIVEQQSSETTPHLRISPAHSSRWHPLIALGVALLTFSNHLTLHGKYVYDDKATIQFNSIVQGDAPLLDVFKYDYWGQDLLSSNESHKSFRPVTTLSFRFDNSFAAETTLPFHLTNVVLHALCSVLVYYSGRAILESADAVLLASLIFATHPVHTESVSNITGADKRWHDCSHCSLKCGSSSSRRSRRRPADILLPPRVLRLRLILQSIPHWSTGTIFSENASDHIDTFQMTNALCAWRTL